MSDEQVVDIAEWVEKARQDPARYLERQVTEIVLTAIGDAYELGDKVFLKGGILMGVVYDSPRQTADIDFTTTLLPTADVDAVVRKALDRELPRVTAKLGYPDILCKVQSIGKRPTAKRFEKFDFPAVNMKVGYALRGSRQEARLKLRQASNVIEADFSFNEPVGTIELVKLGETGSRLMVYSLIDLIAEKYRALLQQESRDRKRRQDVYDIAHLLLRFKLDDDEPGKVLSCLREKCEAREITPTMNSIRSKELIRRAKVEWNSMAIELNEIPPFEECFNVVEKFYISLPWDNA